MKKRSLQIMGHSTSISMEDEFWSVLKEIAESQKTTIQELITQIDLQRTGNLSSAVRVFVLNTLKAELQKHKEQKDSK